MWYILPIIYVWREIKVAKVYFYKFNINSEIYDVYADETLQDIILQKVFSEITTDLTVLEEYKDEDSGEDKIVEYKFCDINKDPDNLIISGRLVKIYDGEAQSYDRKKDTVDTIYEQDRAASATFSFDIRREEIAFITRVGFRYLQFGKYFKMLLEQRFPENSFELILEKNVGLLKEKVYALKRVLKVNTVIIPPNANEDEFKTLLGASVEEFKETRATKYFQGVEISSKGKRTINPKAKFFQRMFYAVGKGYANMTVEGRNHENVKVTVDSDEETPYRDTIPDNEKDSILAFKERSAISITKLLADKSVVTLRSDKEDDES